MAAGFGAYRRVLATPEARAFTAAGFVARLPLAMTGLGIVLLISHRPGRSVAPASSPPSPP